jgi:hypothetical protein
VGHLKRVGAYEDDMGGLKLGLAVQHNADLLSPGHLEDGRPCVSQALQLLNGSTPRAHDKFYFPG